MLVTFAFTFHFSPAVDSAEALALKAKVDAQGEKVKKLKTDKADKVSKGGKSLISLEVDNNP